MGQNTFELQDCEWSSFCCHFPLWVLHCSLIPLNRVRGTLRHKMHTLTYMVYKDKCVLLWDLRQELLHHALCVDCVLIVY